jgi:hypothetical protein
LALQFSFQLAIPRHVEDRGPRADYTEPSIGRARRGALSFFDNCNDSVARNTTSVAV